MRLRFVLALLVATLLGFAGESGAFAAEKRIALVIGESAYGAKPLATAANDAGLIAQTLQAAGFDVTGARDLDEEAMRAALRDFLDKAGASGPETVAFVYYAGVGLQLEGENYLVPINAPLARDVDIALHAPRVSDYLKPLASMGLKTAVFVLDAAHANPFQLAGQPIAGGLALYEPGASLLLAFNAAPGTLAPQEAGPYGAYAHALAEMIRGGGMPLGQVFDETRLRVSEVTKGAQIPWNSSGFNSPFMFFERTAQAPARGVDEAALRSKPIGQFGAQDAFGAAVARDTMQGYEDYLIAYPNDPLARRVRAILAARREALFWRKARMLATPDAYWSYIRRYPHGPHVWDARRLLAEIASALEPPPSFAPIDMGYPPPPPEEFVYVDRPMLYFDDPAFGFAPPPPPPLYFLPPPPPDFIVLAPPYLGVAAFVLPVPVFVPVPLYVQAPAYIAPPQGNVIFENLHNSVAVDHATNNLVIANPQGHVISSSALQAIGAGAAGAAIGATLPHFVAKKFGAPQAPGGAPQAPGGAPQAPGGATPPPAAGHLPAGASPTGPAPTGHALPTPPAPQVPGPGAAPAGHALPTPPAPQVPGAGAAPTGHALPTPPAPHVPGPGAAPAGHALPTPPAPQVPGPGAAPTGHALPTPPAPHIPGPGAAPTGQPLAPHTPPVGQAPALHPTTPVPGGAGQGQDRHRAGPTPTGAGAPPPAPAIRRPPPPVVHAPPAPTIRQPPPPVVRAPPAPRPMAQPRQAPPPQPAPPKPRCAMENGKQVCH